MCRTPSTFYMILGDMRHMTSFGVILLRKRFHLSCTSKQSKTRMRRATLSFHKFHNAVQDLADGYGWVFPPWMRIGWSSCHIETVINSNSTSFETDLVARRGMVAWFAWLPHRMQAALQIWNDQVLNRPNGCTCISMIKKKGIAVAPP